MNDMNRSQNLAARPRVGCFSAVLLLAGFLAINAPAQTFTTLHSFTAVDPTYSTNSDGASPVAGLILSTNTLYGTANDGGSSANGTVFAVNTDGSGFTNLHSFTALSGSPFPITNSDGSSPQSGLILSGNTLYATASGGGSSGNGTVFGLNTDGAGFTNLYSFTGGSDGADPLAGLVLSGNTLYGTAVDGGISNNGTVFAVNIDGTGFTNLHTFSVPSGPFPATNSDGYSPQSGLILSRNTLYGTTSSGNPNGTGTVFAVNINGTGFTNLYSFSGLSGSAGHGLQGTNNDGAHPNSLILSGNTLLTGNTLYGTASAGGTSGNGTIFSLTLPLPELTIALSGTNVILAWPASFTGFTLESATNLVSPVVWNANLWNYDGLDTNLTVPVVIGGQNVVTNSISGTQMFYRLALAPNFGTNWVGLRTAMKAAGATSYGHQSCFGGAGQTAYDMFYLPVPAYVIELANANPALCVATVSTGEGPAPGFGCANYAGSLARGEGLVGPQSIGSTVIVFPNSGNNGNCDSGDFPYLGF